MRIGRMLVALCAFAMLAAGPVAAQDAGESDDEKMIRELLEDSRRRTAELVKEMRAYRIANGLRGEWGISPDGTLIAAGDPTGKIEVWRAGTAAPAMVLEGHRDDVTSLSFGPDSTTLHSTGDDGVVRVWNLATQKVTQTMGTPVAENASIESRIEGYREVSVSKDGRFLVLTRLGASAWSYAERRWLPTLSGGLNLPALRFTSDSRYVVMSTPNAVTLHDLLAPPMRTKDPADKTSRTVPADPIWTLRSSRAVSWSAEVKATAKTELGASDRTEAMCMADSPTVVTLSDPPRLLEPKKEKAYLRGWSVSTGKKLWEVALTGRPSLLRTSYAEKLIPVRTDGGESLEFYSAANGSKVRTFTPTAARPMPGILTADSAIGYTADKSGQLIRIEMIPPAKPPTPAPPSAPK